MRARGNHYRPFLPARAHRSRSSSESSFSLGPGDTVKDVLSLKRIQNIPFDPEVRDHPQNQLALNEHLRTRRIRLSRFGELERFQIVRKFLQGMVDGPGLDFFERVEQEIDGTQIIGTPGRFVLFPTWYLQRPYREMDQQLESEFALAYYPLDGHLQERIEGLDLNVYRRRQLDRHGNKRALRFYHANYGHFPGSLVFGSMGIYRDNESKKSVIWEWQSDITRTMPIHSPADLPRKMIQPLIQLASLAGCKTCYLPTFETIWKRIDPKDYDPIAVENLERRLRFLYEAPIATLDLQKSTFCSDEHYVTPLP